ncbi:MAG: serine/threonine protein kinase [Gemmataceae bacterium]|nr:serine/threonine protein kinase [Gemmataceae bacterium]
MLVGKELGPYVVDKELGSGVMGTVFRAKSKKSGDAVAIKLMSLALGSSETALSRFTREVAILKQLDHPNIVKYKGTGRYHGSPFYIMEYVEGESLDHILGRRKRIAWEDVVDLGVHLCAALQHAHDKGIIHRDLKPSNLMILTGGVVKLTDFGIAKDTDVTALTAANSTVGTAAYMSPEQCKGVRDITLKTDLYSMGIMFYDLLTGKKPFVGDTVMEVFLQHANSTNYKRPSEVVMEIPIWLDTLVCQLKEKETARRPINANAVADSLRLIRQKIEAQRGAGIAAASKRRMDRTSVDKPLDEEDKEAARALLGKKKKKETQPFYTRGWFTILALAMIFGLAFVGIYLAFIKTPSADTLFAEAKSAMESQGNKTRKEARDGPIASFLRYYPQHDKMAAVQSWADQVDFEILDKQMHNRRTRQMTIRPDDKDRAEEQSARDALDDEDNGKLPDAFKRWEELSKKKGNPDADFHAWGLVGERYLQKLQKVDAEYQQLAAKINNEAKPANAFEKTAFEARHEELKQQGHLADALKHGKDGDDAKAKAARDEARSCRDKAEEHWKSLKKDATAPSSRHWQLLAAWRLSELK